jgi:hypothetical protein
MTTSSSRAEYFSSWRRKRLPDTRDEKKQKLFLEREKQQHQANEVMKEILKRRADNPFLFETYIKAKDQTAKALKEYDTNEARIQELQRQYSNILKYRKGEQ